MGRVAQSHCKGAHGKGVVLVAILATNEYIAIWLHKWMSYIFKATTVAFAQIITEQFTVWKPVSVYFCLGTTECLMSQ